MRNILSGMMVALVSGMLAATAFAFDIHSDHWRYGMPTVKSDAHDLIVRRSYVLANNPETKFPDWVAYKLSQRDLDGFVGLERDWRNDPWLDESETLEARPRSADDYNDAHDVEPFKFNRGHLAPLASFKGSPYASEVNYYSNITPQAADLNQGPWLRVEEAVRSYVQRAGPLWVLTGPHYAESMDPLPGADEPHTVPSHFWKAIYTEDKIAVFLMPQTADRHAAPAGFSSTLSELDEQLQLGLLPALPADHSMRTTNDPGWLLQ